MFKAVSELCLTQGGGSLRTAVAAGSEPGESGVFVFAARFQGGAHASATPRRHHIWVHLSPQTRYDCPHR
jgi:AraC family transcriptional regulator